jgi:hypothetical protein
MITRRCYDEGRLKESRGGAGNRSRGGKWEAGRAGHLARPYETLDVTMKPISAKGAVPLAPVPEQMLGCGSDLGSSWP